MNFFKKKQIEFLQQEKETLLNQANIKNTGGAIIEHMMKSIENNTFDRLSHNNNKA